LILLIGVKNPWHPASRWPREGSKVMLIDEEPFKTSVPYWNYRSDLTLTGSIRLTLNALLKFANAQLESGGAALASELKKRLEGTKKIHEDNLARWEAEALDFQSQKPIDLHWIHHELAHIIPEDAIVVDELGTDRVILNQLLLRKTPGTFYAGHLGGLGTGLSYALGVKLFSPDKLVVSIMGDGAFNYNPVLPCLGFAQEYDTPVLIVILNNGVYGSQERALLRRFPDGYSARTGIRYGVKIQPTPNYVEVIRAFGGFGCKVEEPSEVRAVLEEAREKVKGGQLALVDVLVRSEL